MADWSELPKELLSAIAEEYLTTNRDYAAFRASCKSWKSATEGMSLHHPHQLPLLILPYDEKEKSYCAYSLSDNKLFHIDLSKGHGLRYCGSSDGWLVIVDDESPAIRLTNPFTKAEIEIPPVTSFPEVLKFDESQVGEEYTVRCLISGLEGTHNKASMRNLFIQKAVVSSDPRENPAYVVMVIHGEFQKLAFWRNGDKEWTIIEKRWSVYWDIVFYRDRFYVVDGDGRIAVCNLDPPEVTEVVPPIYLQAQRPYLVESDGELFQVIRFRRALECPCSDDDDEFEFAAGDYCEPFTEDPGIYRPPVADDLLPGEFTHYTCGFEVFKLDLSKGKRTEVTTLGDRILFLGQNRSLSLSARDFPGFRGSCIYFTDDETIYAYAMRGGHDSGVFDLEATSSAPLPYHHSTFHAGELIWLPSIWLYTSCRRLRPARCWKLAKSS